MGNKEEKFVDETKFVKESRQETFLKKTIVHSLDSLNLDHLAEIYNMVFYYVNKDIDQPQTG